MARKPFNTTIEEDIAQKFRESCNNAGIGMNVVVEAMMSAFSEYSKCNNEAKRYQS